MTELDTKLDELIEEVNVCIAKSREAREGIDEEHENFFVRSRIRKAEEETRS